MEDVEWSILVGLGFLASHPRQKKIARTRGSVLDQRIICMGLAGGAKLVLGKVKLDPRPADRCPDAGGVVSV